MASSALTFQCTYIGEDGVVNGVRVFDATESPGNKVISFDTLCREISSAFPYDAEAVDGFIVKCGDEIIDCDEDVAKAVANAVKYGHVHVALAVDTAPRNEWELVDSASQVSGGCDANHLVKMTPAPKIKSPEKDAIDLGHNETDGSLEPCDTSTSLAGVAELKSDSETHMETETNSADVVCADEVTSGLVCQVEENEEVIDDQERFGAQDDGLPPDSKVGGCVDVTQTPENSTAEDITLQQDISFNGDKTSIELEPRDRMQSDDLHTCDLNTEDSVEYKPMATLGNFGGSSSREGLFRRSFGTSNVETVSELSDPSLIFNINENNEYQAHMISENDKESCTKSIENESLPGLDLVDDALKEVEKGLNLEGGVIDGGRLSTVVTAFGLVVKELLNRGHFTGLRCSDPESEVQDDEEGRSFLAKLKDLLRDHEVVESFQLFLASSQVRDFIIDVCTNDVKTTEELRGFVLSHLGDLLQEVGSLLRRAPQILSLVPSLLARFSEFVSSTSNSPKDSEENSKPVHENILCDGCEQSEERKDAAKAKGCVSGTYIRGIRFKSAIKPDFDLCESCEGTGDFEDTHGPFLKITKPEKAPKEIVVVLPSQAGAPERTFSETDRSEEADNQPRSARRFGLVCPDKQHPLRRFHVPNRLFACDVCDSRPEKGSLMFGCRVCDWDMCETCAKRNCNGHLPEEGNNDQSRVPGDNTGASAPTGGFRGRPYPAPTPVVQRLHPNYCNPRGMLHRDNNDQESRPRAKFVADVSIPDGSVLAPGASFTKIWRVMNASEDTPWPNGCRIVCVGGDMMGCNPEGVLVPPLPSGEIGDICVQLKAPSKPGRCFGYWRLITPSTRDHQGGKRFGQRLWVDFTVSAEEGKHENAGGSSSGTGARQKWELELQQLAEMQFLDIEKNISMLEEEDGNLTRVIERLVVE